MTKTQYLHIVEKELTYLNDRIDRKIISGLGYDSEARRHKRLVGLTHQLRHKTFLGRILGMVGHQYVR